MIYKVEIVKMGTDEVVGEKFFYTLLDAQTFENDFNNLGILHLFAELVDAEDEL